MEPLASTSNEEPFEHTSHASAFLLLVDGRIPTGSYAHSGGIEAAVADGRVHSLPTLDHYLVGRLGSTGLCDAALAIASHNRMADVETLEAEAAARRPSPALRRTSRIEGKGLVRAALAMWPSSELDELVEISGTKGPMWSVALGFVGRAAGLGDSHVAMAATQASVTGPAWATVRLLGLDPYSVAALLAKLASSVDDVTRRAIRIVRASSSVRELPSVAAPLQEIAAEAREHWEVRLFVS